MLDSHAPLIKFTEIREEMSMCQCYTMNQQSKSLLSLTEMIKFWSLVTGYKVSYLYAHIFMWFLAINSSSYWDTSSVLSFVMESIELAT